MESICPFVCISCCETLIKYAIQDALELKTSVTEILTRLLEAIALTPLPALVVAALAALRASLRPLEALLRVVARALALPSHFLKNQRFGTFSLIPQSKSDLF